MVAWRLHETHGVLAVFQQNAGGSEHRVLPVVETELQSMFFFAAKWSKQFQRKAKG